jgi:predicted nucleic acid-binding protein
VPVYFLDTSAFAKLYHEEVGSQFVERLIEEAQSAGIVSRLALVEIESMLATKVRTGHLNPSGQLLARRRILADISQARIQVASPMEEYHYQSARRLLERHGVTMGLRTLDALQLAVALELHRTGLVSAMVAADQRLCQVAEAAGCPTIQPA